MLKSLAGSTNKMKEKSMTSQEKKKKKKKDESLEVRKQYTNPARKNGIIT